MHTSTSNHDYVCVGVSQLNHWHMHIHFHIHPCAVNLVQTTFSAIHLAPIHSIPMIQVVVASPQDLL
jgi:hypothetical protein